MECEESTALCQHKNNFTFWSLLSEFILDNKFLFTLFICILITIPFKDILLPHLIGSLYTSIKQKNNLIYFYIGGIVGLVIVIQIVYIISDYLRSVMLPMMQKFVRERIIRHIIDTNSTNYDEVRIGIIISTLLKLPLNIYNIVDKWRYSYIPAFVTLFFAFFYFLWVDIYLGILYSIVVIIFCFVVWQTFNSCLDASVDRDKYFNSTHDIVDDVLRNMITVTSNNTLENEFEKMDVSHNIYSAKTKETLKCSLTGKYVVISSVIVYFIFLSWYCYTIKKLDTGRFITILIIMFIVINTILNVTTSLNDTLLKWGIIQNSLSIFDVCEPITHVYKEEARVKEGIVFQDVYFTHENGRRVFKNFNVVIPIGKVSIIEGDNGSGKSTLVRLLLRYHKPQCGEIFINGVPYSSLNPTDIRKSIAYIPQNPILLNRTIYDNIVYGNSEPYTKEYINNVFLKLNLETFLKTLPKGIDTEVGTYGSYLSGGQKQVIWIIKTLLMDPMIVIMDEPTASIDEENKELVVQLLTQMIDEKNRTVIMITHDNYFKIGKGNVSQEYNSIILGT